MITYEWTIEYIGPEGEIIDSDFREKLADIPQSDEPHRIGLVRDVWRDGDLVDRTWWYPADGGEHFTDMVTPGTKVPHRFIAELQYWLGLVSYYNRNYRIWYSYRYDADGNSRDEEALQSTSRKDMLEDRNRLMKEALEELIGK